MSEDEQATRLLSLARRDLRAAELLVDQPDVGDGIVGFHAQQAAEKALKVWLTHLGITYPRTHDLSLLLFKLEQHGSDVEDLWELLDLNPFAVHLRYEILDDEPLDHEVTLKRVTTLLDHVEGLLEGPGLPGSEVDDQPPKRD